jgi:menaquinone-9 beta-reductase
MDAEVIVVGGGLAGCTTALGLANRGHQVLVLDRRDFPRDKVCGEGLMPHGVAALQALGIDPVPLGRPFHGIAYHAGGHDAVGRFAVGTGIGVRRLLLDQAIQDAAQDLVEIRSGVTVRGIAGEPGAMQVLTRNGALTCRAIVGADGLNSPVRRAAGLHRDLKGRRRYGLRGHFALAEGMPQRSVVDVYVSEGCELYLTPTADGQINVAALLEEPLAKSLSGDKDAGLARIIAGCPPVAAMLVGATPISAAAVCGPLKQRPTDVVADGLLLVGDAAGFVDAITGEGMSLSVQSAAIAADVLSDCLRRGRLRAEHLRPYARRRHQELRQQLWLTELILWGIRQRPLAERVVGNLARHPELFGQVLAVNTGQASLASLGLRGLYHTLVR